MSCTHRIINSDVGLPTPDYGWEIAKWVNLGDRVLVRGHQLSGEVAGIVESLSLDNVKIVLKDRTARVVMIVPWTDVIEVQK